MKNRDDLSLIKKLLFACLFSVALYSSTVYSGETFNIGWSVDSLNVFGEQINYLEMDVTVGKRFFQVSGIVGYTDGFTQLMHGSGYTIENKHFIQASVGLDLIQVTLGLDGNGIIDYYTTIDNSVVLLDSAPVSLLAVQ